MNAGDELGKAILCECLASVSVSDGELDAREIASILQTIEQICGVQIKADAVVAAAAIVEEDPSHFIEKLSNQRGQLEGEFRIQILKTCILVSRADGFVTDHERDHVICLLYTSPSPRDS